MDQCMVLPTGVILLILFKGCKQSPRYLFREELLLDRRLLPSKPNSRQAQLPDRPILPFKGRQLNINKSMKVQMKVTMRMMQGVKCFDRGCHPLRNNSYLQLFEKKNTCERDFPSPTSKEWLFKWVMGMNQCRGINSGMPYSRNAYCSQCQVTSGT